MFFCLSGKEMFRTYWLSTETLDDLPGKLPRIEFSELRQRDVPSIDLGGPGNLVMSVRLLTCPLMEVCMKFFRCRAHGESLADEILGHGLTQITYPAKVKSAWLRDLHDLLHAW